MPGDGKPEPSKAVPTGSKLAPGERKGRYYYSVWKHPLARVLKFEKFLSYLKDIPKGGTVLDYGSGDQPYEKLLARHFDAYTSADYEITNSELYRARPSISLSSSEIPMPDHSVECVVATEVLEHVYEPRQVITEIFRILKPGGTLVGTVPFGLPEHDPPYDYHRYTSFCLDRMLRDAGFEVRHLDYVGDALAVWISLWLHVASVLPKALTKLGMRYVGDLIYLGLKIPEVIYYYCLHGGLDAGKISRLKSFPLGFTFCAAKPSSPEKAKILE